MDALPISKMTARRWLCGLALALMLLAGAATSRSARAGDASAGKGVFFTECAECHNTHKGHNKKGPSLFGIVGRKAGTAPGYHYSDAFLKTAHWTWTEDKLRAYLSHPKQIIPGTKMKYDGLQDSKDLDNLITYLDTVH